VIIQLIEAVDQARDGEAWVVLGYSSWTHYVREEFGQTGRLHCGSYGRDERHHLVMALSERGMPTRAIAAITGVSQPTVVRDLAVDSHESPDATVTGSDGRSYSRRRRERPVFDPVAVVAARPIRAVDAALAHIGWAESQLIEPTDWSTVPLDRLDQLVERAHHLHQVADVVRAGAVRDLESFDQAGVARDVSRDVSRDEPRDEEPWMPHEQAYPEWER
jgi:hypothetical protein